MSVAATRRQPSRLTPDTPGPGCEVQIGHPCYIRLYQRGEDAAYQAHRTEHVGGSVNAPINPELSQLALSVAAAAVPSDNEMFACRQVIERLPLYDPSRAENLRQKFALGSTGHGQRSTTHRPRPQPSYVE